MTTFEIDLNADMGESFGAWSMGADAPKVVVVNERLAAQLSRLRPVIGQKISFDVAVTPLVAHVVGVVGNIRHERLSESPARRRSTCTATASGTGADLLNAIMDAPLVRCDQVQFSFLGISMAGWNAIISLGGAGAILWLIRTAR